MTGPLSDSPPVIVTSHAVEGGGILEIEIHRPEVHNAVNGAAARLLCDAWLRFRDDDSLTVAILHGAGEKAFCSGADLNGLEELSRSRRRSGKASGPMGGSRNRAGQTGDHRLARLHVRGRPRTLLPRPHPPGRAAGHVFRRLPPLGGAARRRGDRLLAEASGLGRGPAFDHHRSADHGRAGIRDRSRLGACSQPRGARAGVFDGKANLPAAAPCAPGRSGVRDPRAHQPLEAALEVEARNLVPVMQSESTRRGVESFLAGKRFWFT